MTDPRRPTTSKTSRGATRRRELLVEAARIFLRDGLDGTSMDVIASEAGASKSTLYRHFGDKDGLLIAVVQFLCADFIKDIDRSPKPDCGLREGLRAILLQLVHVLSKPSHPDFFRLIVAGSQRLPQVGEAWHEHGPLVWHDMLGKVFDTQIQLGVLPDDLDYSDYPEILFDAVFADMIIRTAVLGKTQDADKAPGRYIDKLLDGVVAGLARQRSERAQGV